MKAVILAGGKGTRLAPYTTIFPKPLMPIDDMPILEILLRQMKRSGVTEAILAVGYLKELLRAYFKSGERLGMDIRYSFEGKPLGTAGPLSLIDGIEETFIVSNGDVLTTLNLQSLIDFHHENQAIATIAMHTRKVKIDLGVLKLDDSNRVRDYIEKPVYDFNVSMGIYVFEAQILRYIPQGEYLDFPDLVLKLIRSGEKVIGYPFDGYWQDLGRPDDYLQAINDFERIRPMILGED